MKPQILKALLPCLALALTAQSPAPSASAAPKAPVAKPDVLRIGAQAPAFKASRWVKGTPIQGLKKGEVYVVEFWATWCGPCRATIPHLTELAKARAGKATFVGVDVWERGSDEAEIDKQVDAFVKEMGDKMGYAVCRDTTDAHMAKAWMQAANQNGIPCAFIVNQEGRIAYIGHPAAPAFTENLDKVIAGTLDLKAAAEKAEADAKAKEEQARIQAEKNKARQAAWKEVSPAILEAEKAKDWAKVLTLSDAAEAKYSELKPSLKRPRFVALAATDAPKAQALLDADLVKADVASYFNSAMFLYTCKGLDKSWYGKCLEYCDKAIALEPKVADRLHTPRTAAQYRANPDKAHALLKESKDKAALGIAEVLSEEEGLSKALIQDLFQIISEAAKDPKAGPMLNQNLSRLYFLQGQPAKAAETLEKFITFAKANGAPPSFLANAEGTLKEYKAAIK